MKKFYLILLTILLGIQVNVFAQTDGGVSIGKGDSDADPSAILELVSNNKGLLVPRMTTAQRVAIVSPAEGLVVYDTTLGSFFLYGKTAWSFIHSGDIVSATTAPASTNNTLYYNTTEKQLYAYVSGAWAQVGTKEQLLSLTGSTLNLIEQGKTTGTSVDLSTLLQLGVTGTTLKISGGNSVSIAKTLSLSGYILTLDNSTADFTSLFAGKVDKTTTINGQPLSGNVNISVPTSVSQLTNDAGYITSGGLSGYESTSNKITTIAAGVTNTQYPSALAVKTYADALTGVTPIADATTLGKIQIAGDLGGLATAPTVPGLALKAPLASPALTGTPTAPTAVAGTNTTQIATTAFVLANGGTASSYAAAPAVGVSGATYYNTTDKTLYVSNGTAWEPLSTGGSAVGAAAAPGSPSAGDMYYNTIDKNMYYYDGAAWVMLSGVATAAGAPAGTGVAGETYFNSTTGIFYVSNGTAWVPITSVTVEDVLTSISTTNALSAAQGKALNDADALKAPIASPTFTGVPAAPTAALGTNTTQVATTAFVLANGGTASSYAAAPAVGVSGATYYNTTDKTLYVSNGTAWEPLSTGGSAVGAAAAPGSPSAGDMYYNTIDKNMYYYDGAAWVMLSGVAIAAGVPAGTGVAGETYFNSTTGIMYVSNGTAWVPLGDMTKAVYDTNADGIVDAAATASTATSATTATTATNIAAGTANAIPYQTGAGATSFLAPGTSGYVLQTNGAGSVPTWVAPSGGITTVGAVSVTSTANAATITGSTINLAPADASNPGLVSTDAQNFAGDKTFLGDATVAGADLTLGVGNIPTAGKIVMNDAAGGTSFNVILSAPATVATSNKTITLPDATGTVALTSDLPAAITASNGLTRSTNDIQLGGPLSANTTIAQGTYNMAFTGTGTFSTGTGAVAINGDATLATGKSLKLTDATTNTIGLVAPSSVTTYTLTLPTDDGTADQVLKTDGAGALSWTTPSNGVTDLSYTPSATNGIVVSNTGTDATIPAADGTNAGLVSTGVQTIAGAKTFSAAPTVTPFSAAGVVHNDASGVLSSSSIVNADVDAAAAIAGSKISPVFTSDISTTGDATVSGADLTLGVGTTAAAGKVVLNDATAADSYTVTLQAPTAVATSNKTITLPDATGTVALTSDVISFNLLGDITGTPGATTIASDVIVNADVKSDAAIAGTKIAPDFGSQVVTTTGAVAGASFTAGTGAGTTAGSVVLNDATAGDSFTATIKSPTAIPANYTLTLPADDGTADQVLKTDGAGALSWTTPSNGVTDLSYTPSATDGIVVSNTGTDATIPAADGTNAGLVSTAAQTFAGNKTLSGATTFTGNVSQTGATTFGTGTGAISLNGDATLAAGKSLTYTAGAGNFDQSASTGTFKTGTGAVAINGDATLAAAKSLKFTDATTNTVELKAPATVTPYTLTLPDGVGANGSVLSTDASGNLSWNVLGAGGVASLGTPAAATDGNGGSITGTTLTLSLATAANPGLVSTASQTFAGAKTFSGAATFSATPTVTPFSTAGVVHNNASGLLSSSLIVNADVDAAAAIAGSKIDPAFGAQNISQTGASTFSTGTGAISLNGDATLAAGKSLTLTGSAGTVGLTVPATVTAPYTLSLPADDGTNNQFLTTDGNGVLSWTTPAGAGTVTSVSVTTANGISGTVLTPTATPAISLDLAAITPTSVAINASKTAADASAALDITATDKGILIPRMTKFQREAIAVSAARDGLMVYQTDDIKGFYYYDGTNWVANNSDRVLNVTNVPDADYTILPTDDILLLNHSSLRKLIFPTSGIPVGKRFYISNIGSQNYEIWPLDAMRDDASPAATVLQASYTFMYIGGTVDSYICVSGY